jgi:hypothetical protein
VDAFEASMAQVWSDDDEEGAQPGEEDHVESKAEPRAVVTAARNASLPSSAQGQGGSRILSGGRKRKAPIKPLRSKLAELLVEGKRGYKAVTRHLMGLSPPQVDLELQALCLGDFDEEGLELLGAAMRYLASELRGGRNFEAVQAYLSRFLEVHSPVVAGAAGLRADLQALRDAQERANRQVKDLVQHNLCLLGFFCNMREGV